MHYGIEAQATIGGGLNTSATFANRLSARAIVDTRRAGAQARIGGGLNASARLVNVLSAQAIVDVRRSDSPIPSNYGLITWDGSVLTVS